MTCIVGVVDDEGIIMAADSNGVSAGYNVTPRADRKVFVVQTTIRQPMLVGFTSSYRMGQLLKWWNPPAARGDLERYMQTTFIDGVRRLLRENGYMKVTDNREEGGTFMVGYHRRLYVVHSDFQVAVPALPYAAVGSGEEYALGSLYTSDDGVLSTEARARIAVEAASAFNTSVGGDVDVLRLGVVKSKS